MSETGKFVIYSRKSRFTGKGESIENQIDMCRQYIRTIFGDAAADSALVYEDEGFSGGNLERPQFKKMMADAKKKEFRAIVVYRLDRISRNIGDFAGLIEELNGMKIDFISIREQFDTSSPMGRAMMYISSVFSQLERETIAERIRDNMHELAKTGRWLGGTTPTGYISESMTNVTIDGKVKKACKLKTVPEEIGIVRTIFDKFIETGSLTKTETYLLQNGYQTKNGKNFTRFSIRGILTNPVYMIADDAAYQYLTQNHVDLFSEQSDFDGTCGVMAYNRTFQQHGKANQLNPMEEWIVSVGKHKGIVEGSTWVKVQSLLEQNRSKSYRKPRGSKALLSGLLICGSCGGYMRPKLVRGGELAYTYICSMKERSRGHICSMKNCRGDFLDKELMEQIKNINEDRSEFIKLFERSRQIMLQNWETCSGEAVRLETDISSNDKQIRSLVCSLGRASGTAAEAYIMEQIDERHRKGEGMRRRLSQLKESAEGSLSGDLAPETMAGIFSRFQDITEKMSVEQKRAAVRTLVKQVIWDGEVAHVILYGSAYQWKPSCEDSK